MKSISHLKRTAFLFIIFLTINASTCQESDQHDYNGKYNYKAYDTENNLSAEGEITIKIDGNLITGSKDINNISGEAPEAGTGTIHGSFTDSSHVQIYLWETGGPYLVIEGIISGEMITGTRIKGSATAVHAVTIGTFVAGPLIKTD